MFKTISLVFACLAAATTAFGLDYPPVSPANQPLVVVRAVNADAITSILDTAQAKALELDTRDYSGPIPGVDARIDSLRAFITALSYGKAKNLWYCLSQVGTSLANQAGAFGWDAADSRPNAPLPQVTRWLEDLGLDVHGRDLEVRPIDGSHARIIISRDSDARNEILGGTGGADAGWRNNLTQFLADKNGGLGIWANTRPLLGLLTLVTGIDFRAKMNAHNMGVPVSAQINLYNNKGDLGFDARLNNILPDEWTKTSTQPVIVQTRPDAVFDINFPTPAGLWDVLDLDKDVFFLANIDILPLIPRSANISAWRGADGEMHWSAVCLMGNKEKFNQQLRRLQSWLQIISAVSSSAFNLSTVQSTWGDELWKVRIGPDEFVMGVVDVEAAGKDNAFLVMSGSATDWPNPFEIKVRPAESGSLIHWAVNLDQQSRDELIQNLADLSQERGARDFTASFFEKYVPWTDTGWIAMEGKSLHVVSTHGLMPVLIPGIGETVRRTLAPQMQERKVASRLRFLLDLASQSRFRGIEAATAVPSELPADLSELLFSDAAGREWLDRQFGKFPGVMESVSQVIATLASGSGIDGYRYRIDSGTGGDGWNISAQGSNGDQMRIDARGNLSVYEGGSWANRIEPILDLSRLMW